MDTVGKEEGTGARVIELTAVVALDALDGDAKLCAHVGEKVRKGGKRVMLWIQNRSTTHVVEAVGATWSGNSPRELAGPTRQQGRESEGCMPLEVEHPTDRPTVLGQ